jgi:hypothetical protein
MPPILNIAAQVCTNYHSYYGVKAMKFKGIKYDNYHPIKLQKQLISQKKILIITTIETGEQ